MKDWMTDFVLNFVRCDNPTCRDDATSPWPPTEYPEIRLQSIAKPRMYNMVELSDEFKDMVNFFDSIDSDIAPLSERLNIGPLE
ncbi:juvenile hormone esterase [Manduca sexta]|nr:juvenile hormone esterase [Manduca sexta]